MGKYSNLIFAEDAVPDAPDGRLRIVSALKVVDFTTSSQRQVLPGMIYENPPAQDKRNPLAEDPDGFAAQYAAVPPDYPLDKFILSRYCGISAAVAREMVFIATRHTDTPARYADAATLWRGFEAAVRRIRENDYAPCLVLDGGKPVEYAFLPLTQYISCEIRPFEEAWRLLDVWFESRDRDARLHQRAADILRLLRDGGLLMSDNVLQDGTIMESRYAVERRDRTIHERMREYLYTLKHMDEFETSILPVGDGVALSVKNRSGKD